MRARHHKYFVVEDARDEILRRHQQAGVAPGRTTSSDKIEMAAAQTPVDPSRAPEAGTPAGHPAEAGDTTTTPAPGLPPADSCENPPNQKPYVPIRAGNRRIATLPGGMIALPAAVVQEQAARSVVQPVPEGARVQDGVLLEVPTTLPPIVADPSVPRDTIELRDATGAVVGKIEGLAVPEPEPEVLVEPTLADLPIGHHDYEYLSGTAGTGKTFTSKLLLELSKPGTVVLAATTGIASVNLGEGTTIHSLLGFFDARDLQEKFQNGRLQRQLRSLVKSGLRRILVDEVSMMDGRMVTVLARAVAEVNQPRDTKLESVGLGEGGDVDYDDDETPAGEIPPQLGLTLVGDFAQLPPVPDTKDDGSKIPAQFAFESPEWGRFAAHTHKLTKIWRQTDLPFVQALHAVRRGDVVSAMKFFTAEKFSPMTDLAFEGTTIFAKNIEVDRHNQLRLDQLTTPTYTFEAARWGKPRNDWKNIPDKLQLKDGALVMVLANRRVADGPVKSLLYANGDLGTLVRRKADGICQVELKRNGKLVDVVLVQRENTIPCSSARRKEIREYDQLITDLTTERDRCAASLRQGVDLFTEVDDATFDRSPLTEERRAALTKRRDQLDLQLKQPRPCGFLSEDGKSEIIGTVTYMPLRVAYAATVHKTQGLTLDRIQVNIRDGFFKTPGMLFVALSRARTPEGLRIVGDPRAFMERCRVDGRVVPWL